MNIKQSFYTISLAAMMSMSAFVSADAQNVGIVPEQKGEKTFTLEDLNFGGTNYRNMIAKNRWCTWWGDQLVRQDAEECFLVDKATGKETKLFSVNEINQWIALTKDIKVHFPIRRKEHRCHKHRKQDFHHRLQETFFVEHS